MVIRINRLPARFVIPTQPVLASRPPSGPDWVHEIKHDGYRMIVHRDGPTVRLYSRNAYDWTVRLAAIATAAKSIKAKSFTIDGEAVVLGPDGLPRFEELSRREAARTAILYAFDLIELDGEDLRRSAKNPRVGTFVVTGGKGRYAGAKGDGTWDGGLSLPGTDAAVFYVGVVANVRK